MPLDVLRRIAALGDRFEAAWRGAERPSLKEHLAGLAGTEYADGFHHLLGIELELRRAAGDTPTAGEYLALFPDDGHLIHAAFADTVTAAETPVPRTTILAGQAFGAYDLLGLLGRGGMGVVYRARQRDANRIVALKLIRADLLDGLSPTDRVELLARFRTEARATAALNHDHIVTVYDVGLTGDTPYYAMRLIEGRTLAAALAGGPVSSMQATAWLEPVARAVHAAHECGVIHRDLKPANILLDTAGRPLVSDFGLAKVLAEGQLPLTALSHVGTPGYMAPEMADGRDDVAPVALDVYGLGAILYACLTGQPPHHGPTVPATLSLLLTQAPTPPRQRNPRVPRRLDAICRRCLERDPKRRYPTAAALADDLGRSAARRWPIYARAAAFAVLLGLVVTLAARRAPSPPDPELSQRELARRQQQEDDLREEQYRQGYEVNYAQSIRHAAEHHAARRFGPLKQVLEELRPRTDVPDLLGFEWHYLARDWVAGPVLGRPRRGPASGIAFSPDGRLCAVSCAAPCGDPLRVYDRATGTLRREFTLPSGKCYLALFSPDGRRLAAHGGPWGSPVVRVWDTASGRVLNKRALEVAGLGRADERSTTPVHGMAFWPDSDTLVLTAANDTASPALVRWSFTAAPANAVAPLWPDPGASGRQIRAVRASANGRFLVAAVDGGRTDVVSFENGDGAKPRQFLVPDPEPRLGGVRTIHALDVAADGSAVATRDLRGVIQVFDRRTGVLLVKRTESAGHYDGLTFSPDGQTLAVGNRVGAKKITFWDRRNPTRALAPPVAQDDGVHAVAFAPDGRSLAVGDDDGRVHFYDASRLYSQRDLPPSVSPPSEVWALAYHPDGRTLAAGRDFGVIELWDTASGTVRTRPLPDKMLVTSLAFSPNGHFLVTGHYDGRVRRWDWPALTPVELTPGHQLPIQRVVVSPDSRRIASRGRDGIIQLRDAVTGVTLAAQPCGWRSGLAFAADGRTLAGSGIRPIDLALWDGATLEPKQTIVWWGDVTCVESSPDGRLLAIGARDVSIWDSATMTKRSNLRGYGQIVDALAFSPDNRTLAVGSDDGTVKLWHVATGQEVLTLREHKDKVRGLCFSPNGRTLASASHDGTIKLWETAHPEP